MSRAYRISVRESLQRVIRAKDHVSTQLELLEILPSEEMAALLEAELLRRGFAKKGDALTRTDKGVTVQIDPVKGEVTVHSQSEEKVELEREREGRVYEGGGPHGEKAARENLRKQAQEDLKKQAADKESQLQKQVTDRLEGQLADLKKELDQAVNRVTADALKQKAARLGQIKELTEDRESGSLTIVVEV